MKPLAIDLFCGLGGWTEGLMIEGYEVIGFDIERHEYDDHRYPSQLVLQDVLTLSGAQFKDAALIVASPPCQAYSYRAMPWKRAKALPPPDNSLFDACFRIQREASAAAGHHVPMVVENVRGAIPWVGRSRWNYGSFHLWGDVPALMPMTKAIKVPSFRFDGSGKSFQTSAVNHTKNNGGSWFNIGSPGQKVTNQNPVHDGVKRPGMNWSGSDKPGYVAVQFNKCVSDGIKMHASGRASFDLGPALHASRSQGRKYASAMIAKIPLPLARHIGRYWHPDSLGA